MNSTMCNLCEQTFALNSSNKCSCPIGNLTYYKNINLLASFLKIDEVTNIA